MRLEGAGAERAYCRLRRERRPRRRLLRHAHRASRTYFVAHDREAFRTTTNGSAGVVTLDVERGSHSESLRPFGRRGSHVVFRAASTRKATARI